MIFSEHKIHVSLKFSFWIFLFLSKSPRTFLHSRWYSDYHVTGTDTCIRYLVLIRLPGSPFILIILGFSKTNVRKSWQSRQMIFFSCLQQQLIKKSNWKTDKSYVLSLALETCKLMFARYFLTLQFPVVFLFRNRVWIKMLCFMVKIIRRIFDQTFFYPFDGNEAAPLYLLKKFSKMLQDFYWKVSQKLTVD